MIISLTAVPRNEDFSVLCVPVRKKEWKVLEKSGKEAFLHEFEL